MKYSHTLLYCLVLAVTPALVDAKSGGRIDEVIFESRAKTIEFTITATTDIDDTDIEQYADDQNRVLVISLRGVKAKRRWIKVKDPHLKKVLLYPSRKNKPSSILRIRFKKAVVDADLMRGILVFVEDSGIRIAIPRPGLAPEKSEPVVTAPMNNTEPTTIDTPDSESEQENHSSATPIPAPEPKRTEQAPPTASPESDPNVAQVIPADTAKAAGADPTVDDSAAATPTEDIEGEQPASAATDPDEPQAILPVEARNATGLVFMPGVRTRDILAGFTDLSLRLEETLQERKGTHRIAVIPFRALDKRSKRGYIHQVSEAVMTSRLLKRPGIIQSDPELLARVIEPLTRDDEGAINELEARAAGVVVGADTLIKGTVEADGNGFTIGVRAFDIAKGHQLGEVTQEFEGDAFLDYVSQVRDERTPSGAMLRSAVVPGWGQLYQGKQSRGAVYLTLFSATLAAGIGASISGSAAASDYEKSRDASDVDLRETANARYAQANAFFVTSGMIWLAAMVDSAVSSDRTVRIDPELYEERP